MTVQEDFAISQYVRELPAGAAEAAPADTNSMLVQNLPTDEKLGGKRPDALLMLTDGNAAVELGVWDLQAEAWVVAAAATLVANIPTVIPWPYGGGRVYVRHTGVLGAAVAFAATRVQGGADQATALAGLQASLTSLDGKVVAPGTWTPATAAAPADSGVISAAATTMRSLVAANSHATTTVYLQLFDSATVPIDGTAPRIPSIPIVAGQTIMLPLGALTLVNGLSWASSSTVATKTITAITPLQVSAEIG